MCRITLHDKSDTEAYQYKIRKQEELNYQGKKFWLGIDLSLNKAVVKEVSRSLAKNIILKYEWLGDMAITNKFYGIFFGDYCGGVICIATFGSFRGNGKYYGVSDTDVSYFARGACSFWTPKGAASKLLSWALKYERKRGAKIAVAYADTEAGEYGTVYQATNWLCLGKQKHADWEMAKNGRNVHSRIISNYAKKNNTTIKGYVKFLEKQGYVKQTVNPKIRYCYILNDEDGQIINKIKKDISEYPKRAVSVNGSTGENHTPSQVQIHDRAQKINEK
jgi:hypothetical protein